MIPLSERLQEKIKPCPFCGQKPVAEACDRLVVIGCKECGYTRGFPGIVQSDHETPVTASYDKNTGEPIEWYDMDAENKAVERWNTRYKDEAHNETQL
ncbi:MAG: Lar family restriction alleviation protein [Anaerolineaceae bacterium]|nr:Lar family restriction alleviation protein [Anaerolineaceae bacterium]